jgi:hypothetical protein
MSAEGRTGRLTWTHWHLLGRLIDGWRVGDRCLLHDLEANGYAFKNADGWHSTSEGIRAHAAKLASLPLA